MGKEKETPLSKLKRKIMEELQWYSAATGAKISQIDVINIVHNDRTGELGETVTTIGLKVNHLEGQ